MALLETLLYIADENAREVKVPYRRRTSPVAMLEEREWLEFKAKLEQRSKLLQDGLDDIEEDDVDMLIALIGVLEKHTPAMRARHVKDSGGLTISEIVRALQVEKVLSLEFHAAARNQTQRLLQKLQDMSRAISDESGRWTLRSLV